MELVSPGLPYLPSYSDSLRRGWAHDNLRLAAAAQEELERIACSPIDFVESLTDPEARGSPIALPDGSTVPRLPGFRLWMWDGEFCGSIELRWQAGTTDLPAYCLGHIGYSVVPWKRRRGYATQALRLMLPMARERGLVHVDLTTDPDNVASQRVILANGGQIERRFRALDAFGNTDKLLLRIQLGGK
jgi:predicted acetyltransferase